MTEKARPPEGGQDVGVARGSGQRHDGIVGAAGETKRTPYGATPEDWLHFDLILGLGADLLPVVSNPHREISPDSSMTDKGKTPSDYNAFGQIRGIQKWTQKQATSAELERWSKQPDYGICVQTRLVRAIDVDVDDPALAEQIRALIASHLGMALPRRFRSNSAKFLHPFTLVGEYGKRVIFADTDKAKIEFLMTGQQFVAVAQHPSGARYEWDGGLPDEIPAIPAEVFEDLFDALQERFGVKPPTTSGATRRDKGKPLDISDKAAEFMHERGHVIDYHDGGIVVQCPWEHKHSMGQTGDRRTLYYPAGSNGMSDPGFKCMHANCSDKTFRDYWAAIGYEECTPDDFEDLSGEAEPTEHPLHVFYAYLPAHHYLHRPTRAFWPAASVDGSFPMKIEKMKASQWLDKHRAVQQATWHPGHAETIHDKIVVDGGFIHKPGMTIYNRYRAPSIIGGDAHGATRWREHLRTIYPGEADHIERWLAQRIQRPADKINHALVLGGAQGIGKDSILEPARRGVGAWNWRDIDPKKLVGTFNPWVEAVVLRINEARDLGDIDRFAFYDHSKTYIAAPPDVLICNDKHAKEYPVFNVMGVILTTNHKTNGIYLPLDDRRHYVAWSESRKEDFDEDYWLAFWQWLDDGGDADVVAYLRGLDLREFNPKAPPPKTEAFYAIVQANANPDDVALAGLLTNERGEKLAATTLEHVARLAFDSDSNELATTLSDPKSRRRIPHMMERAGYVSVRNPDAGDGLWRIGGRRVVAYADVSLPVADRIRAVRALVGGGK